MCASSPNNRLRQLCFALLTLCGLGLMSFTGHPVLSYTDWKSVEMYVDSHTIDSNYTLNLLEAFSGLSPAGIDSAKTIIKQGYDQGLWQLHFADDSLVITTNGTRLPGFFSVGPGDSLQFLAPDHTTKVLGFRILAMTTAALVLQTNVSASTDTNRSMMELRFVRKPTN